MSHREHIKKSSDYSLGQTHEFVGAFGRSGGTPELLQSAQENSLVMERLIACWQMGGTEYHLSEQERHAFELFGIKHFIHPGLTSLAWGNLGSVASDIRYSKDTLLRCARENKEGDLITGSSEGKKFPQTRNWYLVYIAGLSLLDMIGTKPHKWYMYPYRDFASESFGKASLPAGYYLINYKALCGSNGQRQRKVQDDFLVALGPEFERAPASMICETSVTLCRAYGGKKASLYPAHWGNELCKNGHYLSVGIKDVYTGSSFSTDIEIRLDAEHQGTGSFGGGAGVCIYRKHDF